MKRCLFLLLGLMGLCWSLFAQEETYIPPYYPTLSGTSDYAAWYLEYPDSLLWANVGAEAVCSLRIDAKGKVIEREISSSHPQFVQAAHRVIDLMDHWIPAQRDGQNVDGRVEVVVPFHPEDYRYRSWRQQQVLEACRGQYVDEAPRLPDQIRKLILSNMTWPSTKDQTAVSVCRFRVNREGYVDSVRILIPGKPAFDQEAERIIRSFPRFVPARSNGRPVPYEFFLTIKFWKLDLEYYLLERQRRQLEAVMSEPKEKVSDYTEASFPGGMEELERFVQSQLVITSQMKEKGRKGRVVYQFDVDIDGTMKNFQLVRSLSPLMDAEALRVLKLLKDREWIPGMYNNREKGYREFHVSQFTIPVYFRW